MFLSLPSRHPCGLTALPIRPCVPCSSTPLPVRSRPHPAVCVPRRSTHPPVRSHPLPSPLLRLPFYRSYLLPLVSLGEHRGIAPTLLAFELAVASCTPFVPLNGLSPVVPRSCLLWLKSHLASPLSPLTPPRLCDTNNRTATPIRAVGFLGRARRGWNGLQGHRRTDRHKPLHPSDPARSKTPARLKPCSP